MFKEAFHRSRDSSSSQNDPRSACPYYVGDGAISATVGQEAGSQFLFDSWCFSCFLPSLRPLVASDLVFISLFGIYVLSCFILIVSCLVFIFTLHVTGVSRH